MTIYLGVKHLRISIFNSTRGGTPPRLRGVVYVVGLLLYGVINLVGEVLLKRVLLRCGYLHTKRIVGKGISREV